MPSTSEKQRRAMAIALAARRGKFPRSRLRGASKQMASSMTEGQLHDFARKPLAKEAGYGTLVAEHASRLVDPFGIPSLMGSSIAPFTEGRTPEEQRQVDRDEDISHIIPGYGRHEMWKRIGSTRRDDKGNPVEGATASAVGEHLSDLSPLGLVGSPIGAAVAGITRSRTKGEQRKHDKDDVGNIIMSLLLPGYGSYQHFKRLGSTVETPEKEKREKAEKEEHKHKHINKKSNEEFKMNKLSYLKGYFEKEAGVKDYVKELMLALRGGSGAARESAVTAAKGPEDIAAHLEQLKNTNPDAYAEAVKVLSEKGINVGEGDGFSGLTLGLLSGGAGAAGLGGGYLLGKNSAEKQAMGWNQGVEALGKLSPFMGAADKGILSAGDKFDALLAQIKGLKGEGGTFTGTSKVMKGLGKDTGLKGSDQAAAIQHMLKMLTKEDKGSKAALSKLMEAPGRKAVEGARGAARKHGYIAGGTLAGVGALGAGGAAYGLSR